MKLPAFQFYPGDWMKDPSLRSCSLDARGLWIDMLCLMFESPVRGELRHANGKPITEQQLARICGAEILLIQNLTTELTDAGVLSVAEDGAILSRRMKRDEEIRKIRAEAGKKGGNPNLVNQNASKSEANDNQSSKQNPTPSSSSSISSSSNTPVVPIGDETRIPYQEILNLFHETLPELPKVKLFDDRRKRLIRVRWNSDKRFQSLDFWKRFFAHVRECDWLMGRVQPRPGDRPYVADFDFLLSNKGFVGIIEGKYDARATA